MYKQKRFGPTNLEKTHSLEIMHTNGHTVMDNSRHITLNISRQTTINQEALRSKDLII